MGVDKVPFAALGARLRHARKQSGLTRSQVQEATAKISGDAKVQVTTLARYETGEREAPLSVLHTLATVYGVQIDRLITPNGVSRGTSQPADRPFAEHVLVTAGRIIELAEGMARDAAKQIAVAESLARRSEAEFERAPQTPVTRVSGPAAPKRKKHG